MARSLITFLRIFYMKKRELQEILSRSELFQSMPFHSLNDDEIDRFYEKRGIIPVCAYPQGCVPLVGEIGCFGNKRYFREKAQKAAA